MPSSNSSNHDPERAREMANRWSERPQDTEKFTQLRDLVELMARALYSQYAPFAGIAPFEDRFTRWLNSASREEHRKLMYEFVPWLLFAAKQEMSALSRAAFGGPIKRWLIETAGIPLDSPDLDAELSTALTETYFASLAGYDVEGFCRFNRAPRRDTTGNLRTWVAEGSADATSYGSKRSMLANEGFKYLVVVEDFVGSGTQLTEAEPAIAEMTSVKTLVCPLCCAPGGCETGNTIAQRYSPRVSFEPLFLLSPSSILTALATNGAEPAMHGKMRRVLNFISSRVQDMPPPFGFRGTGSLFLMHTNCPDNVPPMVWHSSIDQAWTPLFPREHRA